MKENGKGFGEQKKKGLKKKQRGRLRRVRRKQSKTKEVKTGAKGKKTRGAAEGKS